MDTEKLETQLETVEIKQTIDKIKPIRFKDDAFNKVKKDNYNFGKKRFKYIPFIVSKDTHQKGLVLRGTILSEQWEHAMNLINTWFLYKSIKIYIF
jgi:hypothetical protein